MGVKSEGKLELSREECRVMQILIIEEDSVYRNALQTQLKSHGFGSVTTVEDHTSALARLSIRRYTHVIFQAKNTNMSTMDFLRKVLLDDAETIAIPSSDNPSADQVFEMLKIGARGFLAKPYDFDAVREAMIQATKGEPFSKAMLTATNRNEAFALMLATHLDRVATVLRQAAHHTTAAKEIPLMMAELRRSAQIAKTFCEGGENTLLQSIESFLLKRGDERASRLGRVRQRLRAEREG